MKDGERAALVPEDRGNESGHPQNESESLRIGSGGARNESESLHNESGCHHIKSVDPIKESGGARSESGDLRSECRDPGGEKRVAESGILRSMKSGAVQRLDLPAPDDSEGVTPESFLAEIHAALNAGSLAGARECAERGLANFPDHAELRRLHWALRPGEVRKVPGAPDARP